jgi:adenosylcobyric acid synthase
LIVGLLVNRFRGDPRLFESGVRILRRRSHLPVLGVLPYEPDLNVPDEDSASLDRPRPRSVSSLRAALVAYPRVSNFDDVDPLRRAGIAIDVVQRPADLGWPDLIVLPGSKATMDDLIWLKQTGLATAIMRAAAGGVPIVGICAGYQMLGESLEDPDGVDGSPRSMPGLSLLPVVTRFRSPKRTRQVQGTIAVSSALAPSGTRIVGYEIHTGITQRHGGSAFALVTGAQDIAEEDGAVSPDGLVVGTSVHGVFADSDAIEAVVAGIARRRGIAVPNVSPSFDAGAWFRSAVDVPALISMLGWKSRSH